MPKTPNTANYPIVVGDVLTAGTEAFTIMSMDDRGVDVMREKDGSFFLLPASTVQAIGTVDPKTGTPRV